MARELTKRHEEIRRDPLDVLARHYRDAGPPRGEAVIVVGPPEAAPVPAADEIDERLRALLGEHSLRDAVALLADETGHRAPHALRTRARLDARRAGAGMMKTAARTRLRRQRARRRGDLAEFLCRGSLAAALVADRRPRLALPGRRDRHHRAARHGARDHRGEGPRHRRRCRLRRLAAAAPAHCARRLRVPSGAAGACRADGAIRRDARREAARAPSFAGCVARGRVRPARGAANPCRTGDSPESRRRAIGQGSVEGATSGG